MKVRGDDLPGAGSGCRGDIVAGVTSASRGRTQTHLAFLIGYMDGGQIVLLLCGSDDIRSSSGLRGHGAGGGLDAVHNGEGGRQERGGVKVRDQMFWSTKKKVSI